MSTSFKKKQLMRAVKILFILVVTALFAVCWKCWYSDILRVLPEREIAYAVAASFLYLVITVLLGRIYAIFAVGTSRVSQLLYSQGLTLLVVDVIAYAFMSALHLGLINPLPLIAMFFAQFLWCILWSLAANKIYFKINKPRRTVVIYNNKAELRKLSEIKHFEQKFKVAEYICAKQEPEQIISMLEGVEAVFVAGVDVKLRNEIAKYCVNHNAYCYIQPHVGDVMMAGAEHMQMFSVPILRVTKAMPSAEYLFFKRLIDIVASLIAIILTSPFMLVTALAIKLQDGGPVLYKQVRLTKDRKEFKVLKFRSMRVDAEKDGVARLSTSNDDRITPVGKIIRAIRFDELPQLFNILKGDMTIVGPRPERPEIAEQYEKEIPSFGLRLQVKAGLTGYAQIYGKYNTEPYDKLKMDLMYINRMSLGEDIRLMFATVKVLFMKESTEGIEEGQTTASHQETEEKEPVGAGK